MKNAIDNLIEKIKKTNNPTVMGLDPRYEMIPEYIRKKYDKTLKGVASCIVEFNKKLIDAVCDVIPAVKPQIAFYEMYGIEGMKAFEETCKYAKEKELVVIADIKRGDIGTTAKAYSNAFLGKTLVGDKEESIYDVDFVTLNPYMGTDCVKPFIEKTSNPSSGDLQDMKLENGKEVYIKVAKLIEEWGKDFIGEYGYSSVSTVVGATYPKQLEEIRNVAKHSYFLIPGYGAQGGKATDIAYGFDKNKLGGIVNASRSLMYAYKSDLWKDKYTEEEFEKATLAEAIRMRDELNSAINK